MSETIKTIKNECLTVQVNTFGTQPWSVKDSKVFMLCRSCQSD